MSDPLPAKVKVERPDEAEIRELAAKMVEANKAKALAAATAAARPGGAAALAAAAAPGGQLGILNFLTRKPGSGPAAAPPAPEPEKKTAAPDEASWKGHFGWDKLGDCHIPYIFRQGEKYCAVRMVEIKLLNKYLNYLHQDIYSCTCIRSYYITEVESRLLNDINNKHCDGQFGRELFTQKDLVVRLADANEFYNFLDVCYNKLAQEKSAHKDKCGFIRINKESVVPYTVRGGHKYVPLFYFEGETDNLRLKADQLEGWDLSYLKFCCKVQGIRNELFASETCSVISLTDIKSYFPPGTEFEEYWPNKVMDSQLLVSAKGSIQPQQIFNNIMMKALTKASLKSEAGTPLLECKREPDCDFAGLDQCAAALEKDAAANSPGFTDLIGDEIVTSDTLKDLISELLDYPEFMKDFDFEDKCTDNTNSSDECGLTNNSNAKLEDGGNQGMMRSENRGCMQGAGGDGSCGGGKHQHKQMGPGARGVRSPYAELKKYLGGPYRKQKEVIQEPTFPGMYKQYSEYVSTKAGGGRSGYLPRGPGAQPSVSSPGLASQQGPGPGSVHINQAQQLHISHPQHSIQVSAGQHMQLSRELGGGHVSVAAHQGMCFGQKSANSPHNPGPGGNRDTYTESQSQTINFTQQTLPQRQQAQATSLLEPGGYPQGPTMGPTSLNGSVQALLGMGMLNPSMGMSKSAGKSRVGMTREHCAKLMQQQQYLRPPLPDYKATQAPSGPPLGQPQLRFSQPNIRRPMNQPVPSSGLMVRGGGVVYGGCRGMGVGAGLLPDWRHHTAMQQQQQQSKFQKHRTMQAVPHQQHQGGFPMGGPAMQQQLHQQQHQRQHQEQQLLSCLQQQQHLSCQQQQELQSCQQQQQLLSCQQQQQQLTCQQQQQQLSCQQLLAAQQHHMPSPLKVLQNQVLSMQGQMQNIHMSQSQSLSMHQSNNGMGNQGGISTGAGPQNPGQQGLGTVNHFPTLYNTSNVSSDFPTQPADFNLNFLENMQPGDSTNFTAQELLNSLNNDPGFNFQDIYRFFVDNCPNCAV